MKKKTTGRRWGKCLLGTGAILALAGGGYASHMLSAPSASSEQIRVQIPPHSGTREVGRRLEENGVVRCGLMFTLYARATGGYSRIRSGEYRLPKNLSVAEVITRLSKGGLSADERQVTIPEGFNAHQIGQALVEKGIIEDAAAWDKFCRHPGNAIKTSFPVPDSGLEGFLFPETYRFLPKTPIGRVAQSMANMFEVSFLHKHRDEVEKSRHTLSEIVTIASMVEREAEVEADRPKIAGVIENRLNKNMRLEIDATVLYALGYHKSRVFYKDLKVNSPYNTYKVSGLPPGPIASPGLRSLMAALQPEKSNSVFYVAGPGGAHIFSDTEQEHNRNVQALRARQNKTN